MGNIRKKYFATMGFDGSECSKGRIKPALDRAYQLRTFEIEHYWKRATYFWGYQVAIFAAFGLLFKESVSSATSNQNQIYLITLALSVLGFLTALAGLLSALGSKFWQENWEHHIEMLEDSIEGRLYKTIWLPQGKRPFSVSRINVYLCCAFIMFWGFIILFVLCNYCISCHIFSDACCLILPYALLIFCIVGVFIACLTSCMKSNLRGSRPDEGGNPTTEENNKDTYEYKDILFRRYDPVEKVKQPEQESD